MAHAIYLSLGTLIIPSPILANRAYLPSYARVISNLLQMGGAAAHTNISIRIPISDPFELIGQGPANPQINRNSNSQHNGQPSISGPEATTAAGAAAAAAGKHRRVGSLSTRPTSMHQNLPVTMQNMRVPSGASAASSTMSAQSSVPAQSGGDPSSTWEMWDTIRSLCGYHPRLSISMSTFLHCCQMLTY
jgi:protein arginine N-methyltransferase 5